MADNQQYGPLAPKQTSASDIRKVIANGPKAIGQGSTIATADELKKKEVDKANSNPKVPTTTKKQTTTTKTNTNVVAPKQTNTVVKKPETQGSNKFASLMQGQISGDLFKNPAAQPINDIKVVKQDNEATHNAAPNNNNDISFMNNFGRAKELKDTVDIDNALMDLYSDIKVKVDNGTLASSDVAKMKQAYPEFANMGDDVLLSMIGDMASIANKKMPFNDVNMKKLKSLYPELNAAAWGFDKGNSENMYQAGGIREQMAQSSKTDLNRFGTAGAVAEAAINPIGEGVTLLDMGAQMIPQVDGSGNENRLKKALSKLTDEDINKYYEQYQNYVKNHGTLSKLYTTQLEGDNTLERLWNWATGKGKKDVDAGFREWLIDRVNNEVNGWAGEMSGAANDLKGIGGPNTAKMYANMPASTIKTVTAVTRAITNPIDTAAGLYHLFGTEEGWNALAMRYGSWDGFAKALEQDPVGVASDGLAIVEGGAGLTKMATGGLSKASLLAGLSTEALGVARTTENLLKIATRLENMAVKAGKIEKTAGLASNLGADLPINKVINGLRKWGESGESMIQKAAKYSANASQTGIGTIAGKAIDEGKQIIKDGPINTIANKLMGSASDTDKLFKAASPNLNKLTNNVNYKNKRQNMDIATQAIVDAGYTPKSMSEWAKAHTETLNKKWNEFKQMVKDKADFEVDVKELLTEVKDYIKREREGATEAQKTDLRKLEVEVNNIERRGKVDMGFIENRKEHYNSSWRDADKLKVGDIYLKGIKLIGNAMRKQQDNILGKGPEQTKKLRKEIAALMDTKEDVIKADVRNQKKKSDIAGGGLVESYGRLSGLGDVIGGVVGGVFGKGGEGFAQAGKGLGKMVLGKAMGKARDVDYLTKKGFEGLSNKKKAQNNVGGLKNKFQESRELGDLYVERDNLRKELKKDNISDSRKEAINKRLDDIEYAIAQKKARAGLGDKERTLDAESKKKVIDMVTKRAKDVGFTTEVLDGMEKDTQGYTDLRNKLIALEKNPGDTTAQHELFHAFFSVVDNKTKTYILDEAKKILKESGMKDVNAEEWLAESFGIYAKRKQIKLGLIDAPKGFVAKVRDFFQKVYEYMQRFNGDRATINKVFDEVLGDRQMKNGIIDLSDLLGDKEVKVRELGDNGLRKKSVYHGSHADFNKFDSSHMGEGEGNQAHGWGHYVAVDKKTAERYANLKYEGDKYGYKGKSWRDLYNERDIYDNSSKEWVAEAILRKQDGKIDGKTNTLENAFNEVKKELESDYKENKADLDYAEKELKETGKSFKFNIDSVKNRLKLLKERLDNLNKLSLDDFKVKEGRNLYTNEIPDPVKADTPTGSNYLEEDGKLSESELNKFKEIFKESGINMLPEKFDDFGVKMMDYSGKNGKTLYRFLERALGSDKKASQFLESLGYDGIHYYGGRDGEAYVIFNDDALQIKDHIRYKKKTDSEGRELSDRQLKYFGNSKVRNDKGELVPVYHFTADNFNTVDFKKGAQNYFWFTSDKNASDRAMGVRPGMEKKRKDMYVDIKNPAGWDEYNKFGTDELKARGYDGVILKEKDGSFEGFIWDKENQVKYVDNQNPTRASKDMRFKKKIGDKEVEITPEADSPDQLIEKNADGLSVMKSFISEKQAEKALNVNKALLDKDGNAYLWTHTNKYSALPFTDFQNYGDSKYKEFANNEIAWVSNSESMSKSYSSDSTKLANTKAPRTDAEFKEYLKSLGTTDKGKSYTTEVEFNVKEGDGGYYVERLDKWDNTYDEEGFKDYAAFYGGMTRDAYDHLVNAMGGLDNAMKAFKERMDRNNYRNVIVERKDGKIHVHTELPSKDTPVYKDKQGLYANMYAQLQGYGKYHYQGIIQNMKNPLVVDLGKYPKGAFLTSNAADLGEKGRLWNDLGSAYDFLKNNSDIDIEATTKAIKDEFKKAVDNQDKIWNVDLLDKIEEERPERYMEYKKLQAEGNYVGAQKVQNRLLNLTSGRDKIKNLQYGIVEKLTPEEAMIKIGDTTLGELYKKSKKAYDKYSEIYDLWREAQSAYKKDYPIGGGVYGEKYKSLERKNIINYLKNKGFDAGALSMMLHNTNIGLDLGWLASYDLSEALKNKRLQTNDYVFYALNKGGYDGVVFKDIVDYGHSTENIQGGDVVAMFNSKQFKAWDNSNPTDSKYISYKKKVSLDKKSEGLQKKNSSGLLAKGRERLGDNGMRYKKEVPEDKKLIALHNLSMDNLKKNKKLGGFAMPSIAITKKGVPHTSYGDISIIFKGDAINPKNNRANKLYGVDAYTPTFPRIEAHPKSTPEARAILDRIEKETGLSYGEVHQWMEYKDHYEDMYPQLKKYSDEYDKLVDYKIFDGFTNTGKRKYLDYNLENIVKYMKKQDGKTAFGNFGKLVGDEKGKLKSVEDARGLEYKETDKESYNKLAGEYSDALWNVFGRITDADSFLDFDWFSNDIEDAFNKNDSKWLEKAKYLLGDYGDKLTIDDIKQIHKPIIEGANIKRPYAEAKPERPVGFDEVGAVVVPNEQLSEAKSLLKDTGLKVYGYKEGERMSVVDKVADDNGLRFKKAFHGTSAKFDKFDSSHMSEGEGNQAHGWGHYVAVEPETAKKYAGLKEKQSGGVYYNIDGKPYKEVYNSLSPFEKEAYDSFIALRNNDYDFEEAWDRIKKDKTEEINNGIKDMKAAIEYGKKYLLEEKLTPEQKERIKSFLESDKKHLENYEKQKKELHKIDELKARSDAGKYMYELDIPDPVKKDTPTGKNYLEEGDFADFKVRDKFIKLAEEHGLKRPSDFTSDEFIESKGGLKGAFEYEMNHRTVQNYGNMYDVLADYLGGQKEASKFLESLGYDGIHYFGEQDGEAFVLFKDESPQIKNTIRYKKGLTAKDQTQTPEFKKWFEGSKVVDKSGKPMVVYHGTHNDFNTFDRSKVGLKTKNKGFFGEGFYFTTSEKLADSYADSWWDTKEGKKGKVMAVYLDVKKPFMWNDYKGPEAIEKLRKELGLSEDVLKWNNYGDNGIKEFGFMDEDNAVKFREALQKKGYDGVWLKRENGNNEIVAFEPNQIKSATDNIGTFDKNNPDIRYKKNSEGKDLSEGQIKYFADSKARNEKGELLVVYRGTKNIEGDRFLYSKDHQTGEDFGKAYYFTTNKDQARGYSFDDTKTQAYKDWWKQWHEYHDKYMETKDEKYRKLRDEWSDKNGLHLRDVNEMDKHPEGFGETRAYYLNIKNPLEYDAQGKTWGVYEKLFKEFKEDRKWRGAEYGYDGIIIHNVKDNSVKRNGEFEDMDVYITFNQNQAKYTDNLNPTTKLSKRFKKNVGLQKKGNGLDKKSNASILAKGRDRK